MLLYEWLHVVAEKIVVHLRRVLDRFPVDGKMGVVNEEGSANRKIKTFIGTI